MFTAVRNDTWSVYTMRVHILTDRTETSPMNTSWQEFFCHELGSYAQLVASDAIDGRRHALHRLFLLF